MNLIIPAVKEVFELHAKGDYVQPSNPFLRIPNDQRQRRIIAMSAYLGGSFGIWGIKWIGSSPLNLKVGLERASAVIVLNDIETGYPLAIMEGATISACRTAAVAALAVRYLAKSNSENLGVLGAGPIARNVTKAICFESGSVHQIKIYDPILERCQSFQKTLENLGVRIVIMSNPSEVVSQSDIVVPATVATEPFIEGDWLSGGVLFINISLRDPKFSVVMSSDKIIVDDWSQANREGTVLNKMYEAGQIADSDIYAEFGEIITGKKRARQFEEERIFFNPMGMAIEDIGTASIVYRQAIEKGYGKRLDFV